MTEKELAEKLRASNYTCEGVDCTECKKTNYIHTCLDCDVKYYCDEILGTENKTKIKIKFSLLEELKNAEGKEKFEQEEKSFNYWFEHNEEIKNYLGEKTSDEIKELLRLGYHFGFNNCFELFSGFVTNPPPAKIIDYTK